MPNTPPRVLISYSHDSPEHEANVLALADRLRADGVDCRLDQYEPWPKEGWTLWMQRQIHAADSVVMVCTETYRSRIDAEGDPGVGRGVCWEGRHIRSLLYNAKGVNEKFLPLVPEGEHEAAIPAFLQDYPRFSDFPEEGYWDLYRRLTRQPVVTAPELGELRKLPAAPPRTRQPEFQAEALWHVPLAPTPFFTGREDVLAQLREELLRSGRVALCGLGGMGKTETAGMYATRHLDAYRYVFWISAASQDELLAGYASIARLLTLPLADDKDVEAVAKRTIRWLNSQDRWLLVIDNADEPEILRALLPERGRGHLLITMRPLSTGELATKVEIDKLGPEEGALFLLRRAAILKGDEALDAATSQDREAALAVVEETGGLPLALDQAGAYIEERRTAPERYLALFQTHKKKLLERRGGYEPRHDSVAVTFSMAHERLDKACPLAGDLLRLCAFLAPDAIPENILDQGASELPAPLGPALADEFQRDELVEHTSRFALLDREPRSRSLIVHRLVQDVIREGMSDDEQRLWSQRAVRAVSASFPDVEYSTWPRCERLLSHVSACAGLIDRCALSFPEAALLLNRSGHFLAERARYSEAEELIARALSIREQTTGPDHSDTAQSLNDLAVVSNIRGKYADGEPLHRRALSIRERVLGPDHPDTAQSLGNLAGLLLSQGQYAAAEPLFRQALSISETALGPDHPDTASSLSNLAGLLRDQGQYAAAEPLFRRALSISESALGPDHPDTATSLSNLAGLLQDQGQYAAAEPLYRRALAICETALGPDHPDTAASFSNLALLLKIQGQYAAAEPLYRRALSIWETALGPDHPNTATSLSNLAGLLQDQGQYAAAEPLFRQALSIREMALGPDHPDTATSLSNLAGLLQDQGQYAAAEPLYRRALSIWETALGPDHPNTATSLNNLASLLQAQGQYAAAEPLFRRALSIRETALGPDHPDTGTSLNNLAGMVTTTEGPAKAAPLYRRALSIWEHSLGRDHPTVAIVLGNLGAVLRQMGRNKEARPYEVRARKIREQHARVNAVPTGPDAPPNSGSQPEMEA